MLGVGVYAQAAGTVVAAAPAFFIPFLHTQHGLSLAEAGALAAAPNIGLVLTLVLWGWFADRTGERGVLVAGLLLTSAAVAGALLVVSAGSAGTAGSAGIGNIWALGLLLGFAGAGTGSVNVASGRVVVGWFPAHRRGLAMGIRQTCQPLGIAAAALAIPALVAGGSLAPALILCIVLTLVAALACAILIIDPPRTPLPVGHKPADSNPYVRSRTLVRIHAVSALLVIPQTALSTFGLVWLIVDQGWSALAAGALVAAAQFLGALGRILVGIISDRVGSRLRPLRWVALLGVPTLLLTAASGAVHWPWAVALSYILASCIAVADNGLAFTSVAEIAGGRWAGRALGIQNTGQFAATAIVGPAVGALITVIGYSGAFALLALAPIIALPILPRPEAEPRHEKPADAPIGTTGGEASRAD
ncbi:MFS transporter [Mycetocola tolaasinivorans]|uniref:MFS transporter n=1 Tax=Mycetocola tolaasinivorans TaxID=76635 RepID=A0A3L7A7N6_9MICO|nr:MFS transporter [Mycetocola tolaasinivorans]RLP76376.1 MFS transporter [Mycetocola tolaasinivorans]